MFVGTRIDSGATRPESLLLFFLSALGFGAFATGVHIIMVPWLALEHLQLGASTFGLIQALLLFPNLAFLLLGGVVADRRNAAKWLMASSAGLALLHSVVLCLTLLHLLSSWSLMGYALLVGGLVAMAQPLRESMVPTFAVSSVQRAILQVSFVQYCAQSVGVLLAGVSTTAGLVWILGVQIMALSISGWCYSRLSHRTIPTRANEASVAEAIRHGVREVWGHSTLRQLVLLVGFNGFVNLGAYVVLIPLLITQVYGLSAAYYGWVQLAFVVGNIMMSGLMLSVRIRWPSGRIVLICLAVSGGILGCLGLKLPQWTLVPLVFSWGCAVAVSSSMGRVLLQSQVEKAVRGRVVSLYQLALFGTAPLGAVSAGFLAEILSINTILLGAGVMTMALFVIFGLRSALWSCVD
ncbi:MFS transporter [Marinibactrum halimedae]|uniref:MFS transporter n=1 Tax=Marinibactrum halimedae TaxID=1444977 RepID=A0AA37WMR0_9GAMM|nr:MFS transporter [Marinibactrum halimedae]MCD9460768.1 MFS transporter [Marinibactrum halimedae]GLS26658.1 MFS transporter [Marinibactrum halimedae]